MRDLLVQGAQIDSFGIGERLVTSKSELAVRRRITAAVENGQERSSPKIKVLKTEKITTPHFKQVYRLFDKATGKALGDVITIMTRSSTPPSPMCCSTPSIPEAARVSDYTVRPLRVQLFQAGKCVYQNPAISDIRSYCLAELDTLWEEIKRFENPQTYFVDLSRRLWDCKHELLESCRI